LLEGLELVCGDTRADGGGTHISISIDGSRGDSACGKLGWNLSGCGFLRIKFFSGEVHVFQGIGEKMSVF
jgi:hypothetical protein